MNRSLLAAVLAATVLLTPAASARAQEFLGPGREPAIAHDPAAGVHLVVWEDDGTIVARRVGRDGRPTAASRDLGAGHRPAVAHDPATGGWLAAWWRGDDVVARPLAAAGGAAGEARTLWSGREGWYPPSVARDPASRRFAVAWGNRDDMYVATTWARLTGSDGAPLGEPVEVGSGDGVTIAWQAGTGRFVLAEQNPGHNDPPGIETRFSWLTGDLGPAGSFNLGETWHDWRPLLAPGPEDETLVIAQGWWSGATTAYRMASWYGGPPPGHTFGVPAGCCDAVAANPAAKGYVLAWDGPVAQHVSRAGVPVGGPAVLGGGSAGAPAVAADAAGAAVVAWTVAEEGVFAAPLAAPVLAPPRKVTGLRAEALDGRVALTWHAVPGADRYGVAYGEVGGASGSPVPDVEHPFMVVPKLRNGRTYRFRIAAKNAAGTGPQSDEVRATPRAPAKPGRVLNLRATARDASVVLRWGAVEGAQTYGVAYGIVGGPDGAPVPDTSDRSRTIRGLLNGRRYHFRVAAKNEQGTGPSSEPAHATPVADPPARAEARAEARQQARAEARKEARRKARAQARAEVRKEARKKARAKARRQARAKARAKARRRARAEARARV